MYCAPSVAAAVLEVVAHAGSVVERYAAIELSVRDDLVSTLDMTDAPLDWQRRSRWCRSKGDAWLEGLSSVGLVVPSAILGIEVSERNVILNVNHPEFRRVRVLRSIDVWLDERLGPPANEQM